MATFPDYSREPDVRPRTSRARQPPGYLADYELGYQAKQPLLYEASFNQATESLLPSARTQFDPTLPDRHLHRITEEERWQRLESRYMDMSKHLDKLQLAMDSTKRMPYPQSVPVYPPSYPPYSSHYLSLPNLELDSHCATPDHSPPRNTLTDGKEPQVSISTTVRLPGTTAEAMAATVRRPT